MAAVTKTLYDTDFALWADTTAKLVREGRLNEVDLAHVAEEIEGLSKSERRAVRSQIRGMLTQLIKQKIQPDRDGPGWLGSIVEARRELLDHLQDSPSLRNYLEEHLQEFYRNAVKLAELETGVNAAMPERCPYSLEELLAEK